jgi:hypothetical protein
LPHNPWTVAQTAALTSNANGWVHASPVNSWVINGNYHTHSYTRPGDGFPVTVTAQRVADAPPGSWVVPLLSAEHD